MRWIARNEGLYSVLVVLCFLMSAPAKGGQTAPSLYGPGPERWVFDSEMRLGATRTLRAAGYDVNSVRDLSRAMTDADMVVRKHAAILLAYKNGREALPILKQALDDRDIPVRCTAARVMGILGDLSGLERMRRDVAELTKEQPKEDLPKTKLAPVKKGESLYMRSRNGRLLMALDAALVLAEFGDSSGYKIAAEAAVQNKLGAVRSNAIAVLAELGRIDRATLQARGCDPEAVLLVVAESETEPHLLEVVFGGVVSRMKPESVVKILEKLERSPHLSAQGRQIVTSGLSDARKQLEREKQAHGQKKE